MTSVVTMMVSLGLWAIFFSIGSASAWGQQHLRSLRRIPARPDIEPFSPRMEQSKLKLQVEPSQTGPQFNQTIKEFREIFGM